MINYINIVNFILLLTQIKDEPVVVETAPPFEEEEWKYDIVDPTEVYV